MNKKLDVIDIILIVFGGISLILAIVAFASMSIIKGIIALAMAGLFALAIFLGKKTSLRYIFAGIALILIIPFIVIKSVSGKYSKIIWNDLELAQNLIEPKNLIGRISSDTEELLSIYLGNMEKSDYEEYKNMVKEYGFIIDKEEGNRDYLAYNSNGYKVSLLYYENEKEVGITLYSPEKLSNITWPTTGLANLLPTPKSNYGRIPFNNAETFIAHIGKTSIDEFNEYINSCKDKGFNIDIHESDKYYNAKMDGYELTLRYLGFDIIEISVKKSNKTEENINENTSDSTIEEPKKNESEITNDTNDLVDGMRKEFKDAMDSYEEVMNSYIEFMKKYNESSSTTSLLKDYTEYLQKYSKATEDFSKWKSDKKMNSKELDYYLKVQTRINKKLTEITK